MRIAVKRIAIAVGALALVAGLSACGHRYYHHDPEKRAEWMAEKVAKELQLNADQAAKLQTLKTELLTVGRDMREQHTKTRAQIMALLEQPTLDRDQAVAMIDERTQAMNEAAPNVVAAFGDFYDSLNDAQRRQLREALADHFEHRRWHGR